jgi:hypothetical protein
MTSELLCAVRSCHHSTVSAVYHAYEQARRHDPTRFASLAAMSDGLEHLAGVEKCGTFVLVCEPAGAQGKVVADFTLPCHLPCCCAVSPDDMCVPPVALPDYRIVTLQAAEDGKTYLSVDKRLHLLANDYDPRFQRGPGQPPESPLELVLDEKQSELGAKLELLSGGIVQYLLEKPSPGVIDRFGYRVTRNDETCAGEDRGCVLLLLLPEPAPKTGTIVGVVAFETGEPAGGSTVTVLETGDAEVAGADGRYRFLDLAPATYTLRPALGGLLGKQAKATVEAGQTTTLNLALPAQQPTGGLRVVVADPKESPLAGVLVSVVDSETGGGAFDAKQTTQDKGTADFKDVPASTYDIGASAPGFSAKTLPAVEVSSGVTSQFGIMLEPARRPTIPEVLIGRVAELNDATTDETRKMVDALYAERYTSQLASLAIAAREPSVKESVSYRRAEPFLTEILVAPDLTEEVLLESYKQVSSVLSKAISAAGAENKGIYRDLLVAVSLAALDRLTMTSLDTLSPAASGAIEQVAATLRQAGVDMGQFKTDWQGDRLGTELKLGPIDEMMAMLS